VKNRCSFRNPVVVRRNRYLQGGFRASCCLVGASCWCAATLATYVQTAYAYASSFCGARIWIKSLRSRGELSPRTDERRKYRYSCEGPERDHQTDGSGYCPRCERPEDLPDSDEQEGRAESCRWPLVED
jgi:hypothetical protein